MFEDERVEVTRELGEVFCRDFPELGRKVYPRRYVVPPSHYTGFVIPGAFGGAMIQFGILSGLVRPWNESGRCTVMAMSQMLEENRRRGVSVSGVSDVEMRMLSALEVLERYDTPTFFPAVDFCAAMLQTRLPEELLMSEVKMPYEGLCWVLPRGLVATPTDGFAVMVGLAVTGGKMVVFGSSERGIVWSMGKEIVDMRIGDLVELGDEEPASSRLVENVPGLDFDREDRTFSHRMLALALNMALAMAERKELVRMGEQVRAGRVKKGRAVEALWEPNMVGVGYRLGREGFEGGNGGNKRMHWRRGHWRNQVHGASRKLRRLVWIEPMLVGVEEE